MNVMVTGGAGYIGSHAVQRLLDDGHRVIVIDSLRLGHAEAIDRLRAPLNRAERLVFEPVNCIDREAVEGLLRTYHVDTVMHFAALAQVGESVAEPMLYYRENIAAMVGLLEACEATGVQRFVFSSSCATYGNPPEGFIPVPEHCPQRPTSPYGQTKLDGEKLLLAFTEKARREGRPFGCRMLRYFNVAGSDPRGLIGEDHDPESHLIPVAVQAALGRREKLSIFGTDYPTPDGTCIRDYVHVVDLIDAHVLAIERIDPNDDTAIALYGGCFGGGPGSSEHDPRAGTGRADAYNVGIGAGYSVRQIIDAVKRVSGVDFRVDEAPRRAGDATSLYNDPQKVMDDLGWRPRFTDVDDLARHTWEWMRRHPQGYRSQPQGLVR